MILDFRASPAILNFVNGAEIARYSQAGVITPDHTIRTKNWPLIVAAPQDGKLAEFKLGARAAANAFVASYQAYFVRHNARVGGTKRMLDPLPRVALVPGLGLFGLGRKKDAAVAADLAVSAVATITDAESVGRFESISEAEMFDMEYWSLEQAKLGSAKENAAGGPDRSHYRGGRRIGAATAKAFAAAGAELALLDLDETAVRNVARSLGGAALALTCDVTDAPR